MSKKNSKFWVGFRIYAAVLVIFIAVLMIYTYNSMKKYEKAQPGIVMDELIVQLEKGDISRVNLAGGSKFENSAGFEAELASALKGSDLTYELKSTSYDEAKYSILKGEDVVATANLKASNHRDMFAILTICDWKLDSVEASVSKGSNTVKITMPAEYTAYVNDVELGKDEQKGELKAIEGLSFVEEYTAIPKFITYEVKGLVNTPSVKVLDNKGNQVDISSFEDVSDINIGYAKGTMPEELRNYVAQAAMDYSNFFSKDLPGGSLSTAGIEKYFPKGSTYIELAENYRLHDMWMYSAHTGTEFIDLKVEDYTVYSDTLFSCSVSFTKRMILSLNGEERLENNNQIYYYVNIDGNWLIAALMDNVNK